MEPTAVNEALEGEIVSPGEGVGLTKHDEKIVRLLEAAFNNAFNITEACQYAGIARITYYDWLANDDIFSYRMSIAQSAPNRAAKAIVMKAIQDGDPNLALRYLTLRDPDFKPKATIEQPEGQQKTEEKLKEFMNDTDDGAYPSPADDVSSEPAATPPPESGTEVAPGPTDIS